MSLVLYQASPCKCNASLALDSELHQLISSRGDLIDAGANDRPDLIVWDGRCLAASSDDRVNRSSLISLEPPTYPAGDRLDLLALNDSISDRAAEDLNLPLRHAADCLPDRFAVWERQLLPKRQLKGDRLACDSVRLSLRFTTPAAVGSAVTIA